MQSDKNSKDLMFSNHKEKEGLWGIYKELNLTPVERWDPFRTIIAKNGTKIGHQTIISQIRKQKPYEYPLIQVPNRILNLQREKDEFCRIIKGKLASIIISKDDNLCNNPLSTISRYENLGSSKVFSMINLFPPFLRILDLNKKNSSQIKEKKTGISLIHVFKNHYQTFEEVPEEELVLYLKNIILSIKASKEALCTDKEKKIQVSHFYNIGQLAGASIPHLHSQTLLYKDSKEYGWKNQGFLSAYKNHKKVMNDNSYCLGCLHAKKIDHDLFNQELHLEKRIIWEDEKWMLFTAYAPEKDGHLRILPKRHIDCLWKLNSDELLSLSRALLTSNSILTEFIHKKGAFLHISQDRNILVRQHDFGPQSQYHLLFEIIPVQQIGGAEILDDCRFTFIFPELIAQEMREFSRNKIIGEK